MPAIAYTVTATLPDEDVAREYLGWLLGGHVQQVLRAGASAAAVLRVTEPAVPIRIESRYGFPHRGALDLYLRTAAPALRAEGLARFGPDRGVSIDRRVAEVQGTFDGRQAAGAS